MDRTDSGSLIADPPHDDLAPLASRRGSALSRTGFDARSRRGPLYAALDLGTNNCRLLIARQPGPGADPGAFRIVDSFCRIVRLGEGVAGTGLLSEAAMARTIAALKVCRDKIQARHVSHARLIATEACRAAGNSEAFLARVRAETDLQIEIIDRETEALLATAGCSALADGEAEGIVLFDIGGGSSEIVWLARPPARHDGRDRTVDGDLRRRIRAWESMKLGVVTLAEKFGGRTVTPALFEAMVADVTSALAPFVAQVAAIPRCGRFHLLGTSGTVTTVAAVHLGLRRYDRSRVDGLWMSKIDVDRTIAGLRAMSYEQRVLDGCIGPDRADLVLAGCAIFEAIRCAFPAQRVRIADRGLREGILMQMMAADRIWSREGS